MGDVVSVLKEDGLCNDWVLAKVVGLERSHDGVVRAVSWLKRLPETQAAVPYETNKQSCCIG